MYTHSNVGTVVTNPLDSTVISNLLSMDMFFSCIISSHTIHHKNGIENIDKHDFLK